MEEQNAVAEVKTGLPAAQTVSDLIGFGTNDLEVPTLLLMQNTSELVGDGKAKLGDIYHTGSLEVVGGVGAPVELIPLAGYKTLITYDMSKGNPQFMRQEKMTQELELLPPTGMEGNKPVRRDVSLNFFVVLAKDLESGVPFPTLISFRRTNAKAGRQLFTHVTKLVKFMEAPAYMQVVTLGAKKEKFETNTYAVYDFGLGRKATETELATCAKLSKMTHDLMRTDRVKVKGEEQTAKAPEVIAADPAEKW